MNNFTFLTANASWLTTGHFCIFCTMPKIEISTYSSALTPRLKAPTVGARRAARHPVV